MESQVTVVAVDGDGSSGRPVGTAELVTPEVALMQLDNRESTLPQLPLRVLVPAAAGGGRGEHNNPIGSSGSSKGGVDVAKVHPAEDGSAYAVLELSRPATADDGMRPTGSKPWWCHIFPRACK